MARDRRGHPGIALGHCIAQVDQHALRNGERHVDRRHLVDHGERRGVGGTHEIADLDIGSANPAGKRRADQSVALVNLQIVQRRLIGLDRGDQDIGLGLGVVDVDLRGGALADQIIVAPKIALGTLELGLILGERAFGLFDLGVNLAASSVNSTSSSLTLAPSSKCTETMVVSTRDFSATLEIGVTVPIKSTSTGTGLRSALASSTEIMRARCGPWRWRRAPSMTSGSHRRPARRCRRAGTKIEYCFFIIFTSAVRKGRDGGFRPLGDICAIF